MNKTTNDRQALNDTLRRLAHQIHEALTTDEPEAVLAILERVRFTQPVAEAQALAIYRAQRQKVVPAATKKAPQLMGVGKAKG